MKIAIVSQPWDSVGPDVSASIGILTYQASRRMAQNHDVIVYTKGGSVIPKVDYAEGVQYRRVSLEPDTWLLKILERWPHSSNVRRPIFASPFYHLGYILQVAMDLRKQKCDIVHVHNFSQFVPIIRALNPGVKTVLHMNCEWLTQLDQKMIGRRIEKTDLVIGCSEFITGKVREVFPHYADRCQTVFNGVDVENFFRNGDGRKKEDKTKRLLFVGRVSPEKGVHVLVEAMNSVAKKYPDIRLTIVGPEQVPPLEFTVALDDELKELVQYYSRSYSSQLRDMLSPDMVGKVTFAGSIPHSQLNDHYLNSDVFVFPSVWGEPFGIPPAEAMACEVPVVAAHSGGITEIVVEGKTGFFVEPGRSAELAEAILRLLEDSDLRKRMGKAGRQRAVELFSWEQVTKRLLGHYERILEE